VRGVLICQQSLLCRTLGCSVCRAADPSV
jgi:hypothetical protein